MDQLLSLVFGLLRFLSMYLGTSDNTLENEDTPLFALTLNIERNLIAFIGRKKIAKATTYYYNKEIPLIYDYNKIPSKIYF